MSSRRPKRESSSRGGAGFLPREEQLEDHPKAEDDDGTMTRMKKKQTGCRRDIVVRSPQSRP